MRNGDMPTLEVLAAEMIRAQDQAEQLPRFSGCYPQLTTTQAYEIANHIHASRVAKGQVSVGRKIGFTNADLWPRFGVTAPIWSHIYADNLIHAEDNRLICSLAGFTEPRIEPEIIFCFKSAPEQGMLASDILACVDWIAHGFEIVQSHFPNWQFQASDTIIDAGLHAALLVGAKIPVAKLGNSLEQDIAEFEVALCCEGECQDRGKGSNVLGSPIKAISHLLQVLADSSQMATIEAGEIITTGTLTQVLPVKAGETWHTEIRGIGLPGLSVRFV